MPAIVYIFCVFFMLVLFCFLLCIFGLCFFRALFFLKNNIDPIESVKLPFFEKIHRKNLEAQKELEFRDGLA